MKPIKMSSTSAITQIPMFNGANWASWEVSMKTYLRLQGVWRITSGDYPISARTTSTNAAGVSVDSTSEKVKKEIRSDAIKAQYGTTGSAGKFAIFREAILFTISDNTDPFSCLDEFQVDFSDAIQAMIILAALPPSWDSFCATMLAGTASLFLALLISSISDEYCRCQSGSASTLVARITGIKRPGNNNWNNQCQGNGKKQKNERASNNGQQTSNGASDSGQSNKHKTRRGKGKGGKGKPGIHAHALEVNAINSASANNAILVAPFATAHFTTIPAETKAAYESVAGTPRLKNIVSLLQRLILATLLIDFIPQTSATHQDSE
ncbi:hypothetical protein D9757_003375 [Collybiopsis confluens]|uniref:DUF4219 domain-containing protein n=1 Tax=Collybiopsis confluens TaxID=2823264 RepID=A0A8H5HYT0_9AGAR|nr:hypothetical protein D9757_003375 [Collybiopsis confluens]